MQRAACCIALFGCCLVVSGCGSARLLGLSGSGDPDGRMAEEERHRQRFLESRNAEDLRWLLANGVQPGQSRSEISATLGEPGQRVARTDWLRDGGGDFQQGDVAWKWGPDREGNSVVLVFRDDRLINFDPTEFQTP